MFFKLIIPYFSQFKNYGEGKHRPSKYSVGGENTFIDQKCLSPVSSSRSYSKFRPLQIIQYHFS